MPRCFVTRTLPFPALDRLRAAHDVTVWDGPLPPSPEELRSGVASADGLLCLLTDRIDDALLDAAPALKVISNYAVGADNVDLDAARAHGIPVGVTPDVLTDATADLTLALILTAARRLPEAAAAVTTGEWRTWEPAGWLGLELRGARLVVVGPGRIGRAVGDRAEAFGMEVTYVGRRDDLDAAVAEADVVSLHAPLTSSTKGLFDAELLAAMKPGAILVNTARGGLVGTDALRAALASGALGFAALDVTDPEPLPPDHPLLTAPNLLVVPHIGSATTAARERMADLAVDNLLAGLDGRPLPHAAS
ncbi:MAG: D-3-phosphoglycerate dehydrogenase [uncultured Solirubrobacteraceae bacterium]|uniref:D-3-phosphoglycerate dehydrogenase n=1 Tax=uncultured Solirubrobacteraceae bacterium TaxID=1162706 RepID=A0A6J4RPX0_9ACTN|nr:MAG: D-3-phosphoglycerate dehydrogenase [uncultured Solirubrobacteraceae bacterium]